MRCLDHPRCVHNEEERFREATRSRGSLRWTKQPARAFVLFASLRRFMLNVHHLMKLQYVALSNLPAAVYQTTYQLKILTTAIFSIVFLQRRYSVAKWLSLLLLTIGVCIVQIPTSSKAQPNTKVHSHGEQNRMKGFLAVMTACISSGLAGAYFE